MRSPSRHISIPHASVGILVALIVGCGGAPASSASADSTATSRPRPAAVTTPDSLDAATRDTNTIVVYKSPTCGCCAKWVEHLQQGGFHVVVHDTEDVETVKDGSGVPAALRTCHTAIAGRYVIEGHVPASDIRRLLRQRPAIAGLAVPGMPVGSPGMEGAGGERYDVVTFGGSGASHVFASH